MNYDNVANRNWRFLTLKNKEEKRMFTKKEEIKYEGKDAVIATVPNYQWLLDFDGEPGDYITIIYPKEAKKYSHRQYPEPHEFPEEAILLVKGHLTAEGAEKFHNKVVEEQTTSHVVCDVCDVCE